MASEKVSHVYNIRSENELTDKEKNAFAAILENYPESDVLAVYTFANCSTDGESVPKGTVFVHPESATVHPDSIDEQMFVIQGVAKIHPRKSAPSGYTTADFQGKQVQDALDHAVPQFTHYNGPSLFVETKDQSGKPQWAPELGDENAFVGVYETTGSKGRGKEYYLVARAGAHQACRDLKEHLNKLETKMTFGQLVRDPLFVKARNMARSNCLRLMRNAAAAIGVPLPRIADRMVAGAPERAEPEYEQSICTIKKINFQGKDAVAIFNHVTPMTEVNAAYDGQFFIQAHPYEGMYMYPILGQGIGLGLPTDTGKSTEQPAKVGQQEGFVWEKAHTLQHHPDLYEDAHRSMDHTMEDALVKAGYDRRNRRRHLVPILVKLCNPQLKRK